MVATEAEVLAVVLAEDAIRSAFLACPRAFGVFLVLFHACSLAPCHPDLCLVACLPDGGGRGDGAFLNKLGASFSRDPPPPPGGVGVGQEWVGGFEGKGHNPGAKGAGNFFP